MQPLPHDYTRAAHHLDRNEPISDAVLADIAQDLPARRARATAFFAWDAPIALRRAFEATMVCVLIFASAILVASGAGMCALIACVFTLVVVRACIHLDRLHRQSRTSNRDVCEGCGYSMRDLPDAIPADRTGGTSIGPRRCPECGCDWPRVPRFIAATP